MGFLLSLRIFPTVCHFWKAPQFYGFIRRILPCMRGFDERNTLKERFPVYQYKDYLESVPIKQLENTEEIVEEETSNPIVKSEKNKDI